MYRYLLIKAKKDSFALSEYTNYVKNKFVLVENYGTIRLSCWEGDVMRGPGKSGREGSKDWICSRYVVYIYKLSKEYTF